MAEAPQGLPMANDGRIDGVVLERMMSIARGFPGRTVSVKEHEPDEHEPDDDRESEPSVRIDDLVPAELAAACFGGGGW